MKKHSLSLIAIAVSTICYNASSFAAATAAPKPTTNPQCLVNVPHFNKPVIQGDVRQLPITVLTDFLEAHYPNYARYQGNVEIEQGNRQIKSQQAELHTNVDKTRQVTLKGDVQYRDNLIALDGEQASMNLNTNDVRINDSRYQLVDRLGRGKASSIELQHQRYLVLKNGSFTTCPSNDNSWSIHGSTVIEDKQEELLEAWNAVFKIGPVPVMYLPYVQYPTGNKRRSGLLLPVTGYNSIDGVRLGVPFYWNIAPNYDLTFTPNWIQHRGLYLQTLGRYLNQTGQGNIAYDFIGHDSLYNQDPTVTDNNSSRRWLFHWDHNGIIDQNWHIQADVTRVSDNQYLVDFDSDYGDITDGYVTQQYSIGYANDNWDIRLSSRDFQIFRPTLRSDIYRTQPQLDIQFDSNSAQPWQFSAYAQAVNFISSTKKNPDARRFHLEPILTYNYTNSWSSIKTRAALLATYYHQKLNDTVIDSNLESNVSRYIPKLDVDARLIFSRDVNLLSPYTQTIEPRIKYVYKAYRDQSNINNYDSSLLQLDYAGLFRDQLYSGLDRIASANQLAAGITSRFYDEQQKERFNFSLGQVYYFDHARTGDKNSVLDNHQESGSVTWAADGFWLVNDDLILRGGLQYDARMNELALANGVIEYHPAVDKMLQLSYRYASRGYINAIGIDNVLPDDDSPYIHTISQLGATGSWALNDSWKVVGAYYYDTKLKQPIDNFIGVLYDSCCWSFGVQYGRHITNWDASSQQSRYENKLSFTFELTGFGRDRNTVSKMLDFGLIPYQTTFE